MRLSQYEVLMTETIGVVCSRFRASESGFCCHYYDSDCMTWGHGDMGFRPNRCERTMTLID